MRSSVTIIGSAVPKVPVGLRPAGYRVANHIRGGKGVKPLLKPFSANSPQAE